MMMARHAHTTILILHIPRWPLNEILRCTQNKMASPKLIMAANYYTQQTSALNVNYSWLSGKLSY